MKLHVLGICLLVPVLDLAIGVSGLVLLLSRLCPLDSLLGKPCRGDWDLERSHEREVGVLDVPLAIFRGLIMGTHGFGLDILQGRQETSFAGQENGCSVRLWLGWGFGIASTGQNVPERAPDDEPVFAAMAKKRFRAIADCGFAEATNLIPNPNTQEST